MFFISIIIGAVAGGAVGTLFTNGKSTINDELTQLAWAFVGMIVAIIAHSEISHYMHYGVL